LGKDYQKEDYIQQFTIRVLENLTKIQRVEKFYKEKVTDAPAELFSVLKQQRKRLISARKRFGDYISPESFER
jgi:phosphoenolpyruvate carboxykinase (GTP)